MKLWKYSIVTALAFVFTSFAVLYTSCTRDSCQTFRCQHEGVCTDGFCRCLDGYEGTQCETVSSTKFLGTYDGITKINEEPVIIDSAYVELLGGDTSKTYLRAYIYSRPNTYFSGQVIGNEVFVNDPADKDITMEYIGTDKIEILIDEVVNGERRVTNFQGTKRTN